MQGGSSGTIVPKLLSARMGSAHVLLTIAPMVLDVGMRQIAGRHSGDKVYDFHCFELW